VNGLLIQGGGAICAALDVPGASFNVAPCEVPCTADAGTLNGFKSSDCLLDEGTVIGAVANGDAVVPPGYQTLYVLTSGAGLVIEAASAEPFFTVTEAGRYTIHTLVYDPAMLDLGIVDFGTTTGFDVNGLLIQGGGSICASLDVAGTSILVDTPDAGALTAAEACLSNGSATLTATVANAPYVPEGYTVLYVLTQGADLTIIGVGSEPSFDVNEAGNYTIHTLVYDPATLGLADVVLGETTGIYVNSFLIQGGGSICAALDVAGAPFVVEPCESEPCLADAGTLEANTLEDVCLTDGAAAISATPNGDINVPAGYSSIYVLTSGAELTIENAGTDPSFTVDAAGLYTIHTLVYDPATLDLGIVEFGVTTGVQVLELVIANGICASLDVAGAAFTVVECNQPCLADAGTLEASTLEDVCLTDGAAAISATPNGDINVPAGYSSIYVLTSGAELTIENAGTDPSFTVDAAGLYTIHTLVYDPATLDLGIVEFGVTTGVQVLELVIANGICASLDVAGAAFTVANCNNGGEVFSLVAWPTAAQNELWVRVEAGTSRTEVGLYNLNGVLLQPLRTVARGEQLIRFDLSGLPEGTYVARAINAQRMASQRFVRVD
jgi:hypothetical protein